jgi:hypothetical protein
MRWSSHRACRRGLSISVSRLALRLGPGRLGEKRPATVVAAKVEVHSIAVGMMSRFAIHSHSADRVFGQGCRVIHGVLSFDGVVVAIFPG